MRISDWSSDVCSSDLLTVARRGASPVSALPAEHGDGTATVRPGSDPVPIVRAVDKPTAVRVENAPSSAAESSSIRVSIDKVDALINMVGELVITQSMLGQLGEHFDLSRLEALRSEEHTSELQSLMRISYAVFCLKKKKNKQNNK